MAQQTNAAVEPNHQETQCVAALIERDFAGVTTDTSRDTVKVTFGDYLPPETAQIAREHGYQLYAVFGSTADFVAEDSARMDRFD